MITILLILFTDFDVNRCKLIGGPQLGERAENGERFFLHNFIRFVID